MFYNLKKINTNFEIFMKIVVCRQFATKKKINKTQQSNNQITTIKNILKKIKYNKNRKTYSFNFNSEKSQYLTSNRIKNANEYYWDCT